jgi:hypothetical protein
VASDRSALQAHDELARRNQNQGSAVGYVRSLHGSPPYSRVLAIPASGDRPCIETSQAWNVFKRGPLDS